ncbi:hypothetical protein Ae201684P_012542 [Aphanomyces euteiches]|uniref:DDE-1 domain-containing protein n=1 Tax=Aphanomyces euteiches TaxID=100861 RepID=A0A6G0WDW9_9STRA|nr:hypothetical protein Ae201684_016826 [Aphanomyces euteiches]KAH9076052.1 hypothetical protein Ae201684P_012542 [Aphanomyces euteiches]
MEAVRAKRSTVDVVSAHYEHLAKVFADHNFPPECIWNLDETGTANAQRADSRQNISVLVCVNAGGGYIPPFFILPGTNVCRRMTNGGMPGSAFAASPSSFLSTTLFIQYYEWFVNQISPQRPVLVLMDGYKAHWSAKTLAYALSKGIHLYALPSHTSHFLQPLDVSVFCHFKRLLDKELTKFRSQKARFATTSDMVLVTSAALLHCLTRTYIVAGFEKCGIYPLSKDVMLSKILGDCPGPTAPTAKIAASVRVESRLLVQLREQGIDVDIARVLCINDNLIQEYTQRSKAPRTEDDWVHGGILMTSDDIVAKLAEKEAKKTEKQDLLQQRKVKRVQRRAEAVIAKKRVAQRRREACERKMMSLEDTRKHIRRKRPLSDHSDFVDEIVL